MVQGNDESLHQQSREAVRAWPRVPFLQVVRRGPTELGLQEVITARHRHRLCVGGAIQAMGIASAKVYLRTTSRPPGLWPSIPEDSGRR